MQRRRFLQGLLSAIACLPMQAWAAIWNKPAFDATQLSAAEKALEINSDVMSSDIPVGDIVIIAPDFAENGAVVQVEITSFIKNTEAIAILVEKNPTPLIMNMLFAKGVQPKVVTRIKMAESSLLVVIVKSGNQYFKSSRHIEVNIGGCG